MIYLILLRSSIREDCPFNKILEKLWNLTQNRSAWIYLNNCICSYHHHHQNSVLNKVSLIELHAAVERTNTQRDGATWAERSRSTEYSLNLLNFLCISISGHTECKLREGKAHSLEGLCGYYREPTTMTLKPEVAWNNSNSQIPATMARQVMVTCHLFPKGTTVRISGLWSGKYLTYLTFRVWLSLTQRVMQNYHSKMIFTNSISRTELNKSDMNKQLFSENRRSLSPLFASWARKPESPFKQALGEISFPPCALKWSTGFTNEIS